MDKNYFIKHFSMGCLYLITASIGFYLDDDLFYKNVKLVLFMALSTLLYPFSRQLIEATAYKLRSPIFWKKLLAYSIRTLAGSLHCLIFFALFLPSQSAAYI